MDKKNILLTTIIPMFDMGIDKEETAGLLKKAITSVNKQKTKTNIVFLLINNSIKDYIDNLNIYKTFDVDNLELKIINFEEPHTYQSNVNKAVKMVKTEYFTVLEFDDEFNDNYFKDFYEYIEYYGDKYAVYSPIIYNEDISNSEKNYLTNEVVWSRGFNEGSIGVIDNIDTIKKLTSFNLTGSIINKNKFMSIGMFKSNFDFTFMFEFILRLIDNGGMIYVIPRISLMHIINRIGSYSKLKTKEITPELKKFWFDSALREYHYTSDRPISYKYENSED